MDGARDQGDDWHLGDAEDQHAEHPRSFFIPSREERESLAVGAIARLQFVLRDPPPGGPSAERMWLEVLSAEGEGYVGVLTNRPGAIRDLEVGAHVRFGPEHVIAVDGERWRPFEGLRAFVIRALLDDDGLEPTFVRHDPSMLRLDPLPNGDTASGWQLFTGDPELDDTADPDATVVPDLAWIMERYPAFGALVFSGASGGDWALDQERGVYVELPPEDGGSPAPEPGAAAEPPRRGRGLFGRRRRGRGGA